MITRNSIHNFGEYVDFDDSNLNTDSDIVFVNGPINVYDKLYEDFYIYVYLLYDTLYFLDSIICGITNLN